MPRTKWEDDEYLVDEEVDETEELDEDEQYVRETETVLVESEDADDFYSDVEEDSDEEYE